MRARRPTQRRRHPQSQAEAEHGGVSRHDIDDLVTMPPAAERSARGCVLTETQCPRLLSKRRVLRVRGHVDDRVDILGRADAPSRWVRDEQAGRASADEHEFVEHGREQAHDRLEVRAIRISHGGASAAARSAPSPPVAARARVHRVGRRSAPGVRAARSPSGRPFGADLWRGSSVTPRTSPSASGHTGARSPLSSIWPLSGGAAYAVGIPRVASPRWTGKAYFTP